MTQTKTSKRIHRREETCKQLAEYYANKFSKDTGIPAEQFRPKIWVSWDTDKRAYCLRGAMAYSLLAPGGWSLLDYIKPTKANDILGLSSPPQKRIHKVVIKHVMDDLQHENAEDSIGTFDNSAKSEYAIELDQPCHGYRYEGFKFYNGPVENYQSIEPDEIRKYVQQDYERMKSFNAGDWHYIGIRAEAEIQLSENGTFQTITSGGLWGVESDSGDYIKEIEQEELKDLRRKLEAIGFSKRAVTAAFRTVEHKDE